MDPNKAEQERVIAELQMYRRNLLAQLAEKEKQLAAAIENYNKARAKITPATEVIASYKKFEAQQQALQNREFDWDNLPQRDRAVSVAGEARQPSKEIRFSKQEMKRKDSRAATNDRGKQRIKRGSSKETLEPEHGKIKPRAESEKENREQEKAKKAVDAIQQQVKKAREFWEPGLNYPDDTAAGLKDSPKGPLSKKPKHS